MEEYKRGLEPTAADASISTASQNFERAREERAAWPEWKQEHTLTKHSGAVQIAHPVMEVGTYQTGPTIIQSGQPTMSSREIAELTGKRPADVMRDIRNMLEELNLAERSFASSYLDSTGRNMLEELGEDAFKFEGMSNRPMQNPEKPRQQCPPSANFS